MIIRFWRWLTYDPLSVPATSYEDFISTTLRDEISYLREELRAANKRIYSLSKRLGRYETGQTQQRPVDVEREPIQLRGRKPVEVRRRELERASVERARELQNRFPEMKIPVEVLDAETDSAINELAELEDKLNGEANIQ